MSTLGILKRVAAVAAGLIVAGAGAVGIVLATTGGTSSAERAACVQVRNVVDDLLADVEFRVLDAGFRALNRATNATDNPVLLRLGRRARDRWAEVTQYSGSRRLGFTLDGLQRECGELGIEIRY